MFCHLTFTGWTCIKKLEKQKTVKILNLDNTNKIILLHDVDVTKQNYKNKYILFYLIKIDAIPQITKIAMLQNTYTLCYFKFIYFKIILRKKFEK